MPAPFFAVPALALLVAGLTAAPAVALAESTVPPAGGAVVTPAAQPKLRVAVTEFKGVGVEPAVCQAVTEFFRNSLIRADKFVLIERGQIDQVLKEQHFGQSGLVDGTQAASMGKLLGAAVMVLGTVTKLGSSYTIGVRFVDVTTGETTAGESQQAKSDQHFPRVVSHLAAKLSGMEWPLRQGSKRHKAAP